MSEEKRSSYRMSKYKGFQKTFAHSRDIEKNMETPKDLFHLKYLSLWEIKWAGKSFFNSNALIYLFKKVLKFSREEQICGHLQ